MSSKIGLNIETTLQSLEDMIDLTKRGGFDSLDDMLETAVFLMQDVIGHVENGLEIVACDLEKEETRILIMDFIDRIREKKANGS